MKKSNNKVSQHKQKRASKNQKRIAAKPYLSRFERKQAFIREQLTAYYKQLQGVPND
jgi:hypothetical protein